MVFTTQQSSSRLRLPLWVGWLCALLMFSQPLSAAEFRISDVHVRLQNNIYLLNADLEYDFSGEALEALTNGVPLTIRIAIEIGRTHAWWWNSSSVKLEQGLRLQYHALSDQYVLENLNTGVLYAYQSRGAALSAMGALRDFPLLEERLLESSEEYMVRLQARLDIEALPSPLRPIAYISPAWRLRSDWYLWSFKP